MQRKGMREFSLSSEMIGRFKDFLSSPEYSNVPSQAKADYWLYHSKAISLTISENEVRVTGEAGNYIPGKRCLNARVRQRVGSLIQRIRSNSVRLMNWYDAFDAVMEHKPIASVELAPYRINFKELRKNSDVIPSIKEMRRRYFARDKYLLNEHMVRAYYLFNILQGYTRPDKLKTIMDIGAGNGNLASLLYHHLRARILIVDLPETLCLSIPFIADLFPMAKMVLPNEAGRDRHSQWDFLFLTPSQIGLIPDSCVDLTINADSFQEMTHEQIKEYFNLIQRVGCCGSYFMTSNRVEKIPVSEDKLGCKVTSPTNCFTDFPWDPRNETVIYEPCRLLRLIQLDDCYLKLESIRK